MIKLEYEVLKVPAGGGGVRALQRLKKVANTSEISSEL